MVVPRNGSGTAAAVWGPLMSFIDSGTGLWLGLDTGGTFTDAVLFEDGRGVIASAKALTTPWNLAIGVGKAIVAVLDLLPAGSSRKNVTLVSVSTTLATNAVVENRFSPVCTLLIGFDDAMVDVVVVATDDGRDGGAKSDGDVGYDGAHAGYVGVARVA